jgi:hypothetical protein
LKFDILTVMDTHTEGYRNKISESN